MLDLIRRIVLAVMALVGVLVTWINVQNQTPWPLVFLRAATGIAIVAAAGVVVGFILMRTALRRHYENWLAQSRRPAGHTR
jgi:uncharacterized SAM-binding protein YcdF (DUF218 family)